MGGNTNYYHWLIDYLPRLLLARKYVDIGRYRLIVNQSLLPFQRATLALLGVSDRQLLLVGDNEAIRRPHHARSVVVGVNNGAASLVAEACSRRRFLNGVLRRANGFI